MDATAPLFCFNTMPIVVAKSLIGHLGPRILPPPRNIAQMTSKTHPCQSPAVSSGYADLRRPPPRSRSRPRPSLRRPDPRRPHGHARLRTPRRRRPQGRRPQAPRHLHRDRPLRHRRHRRRHRLPPRQARHQIPRLGQDGRHLRRPHAHLFAPQGDTPVYKALRIAALESSKQRARELYPHIENKNQQQMLAYRELPDADLFSEEWVAVPIHPREMPGYKSARITCDACGEGINYDREIRPRTRKTLCKAAPLPRPATTSPSPRTNSPQTARPARKPLRNRPANIVSAAQTAASLSDYQRPR